MKQHKEAAWLVTISVVILLGGIALTTAPGGTPTGAISFIDFFKNLVGKASCIPVCKNVGSAEEGYYCNDELRELKKCAASIRRGCFTCNDGFDRCEGGVDTCKVVTGWKVRGIEVCAEHGGLRKLKPIQRCPREEADQSALAQG
jgi:hypothetical protein